MNKTKAVKILLVIAVVIGIAFVGLNSLLDSSNSTDVDSNNPPESEVINLDPPTDSEKQAGDDRKEEIIKEEALRGESAEEPAGTASVIISDANQYDSNIEVRAFIPDHYEDGNCTITFTKGDDSISREAVAIRDVSTTICTGLIVPRSDFPSSGEWSVVVKYKSDSNSGESEAKNFSIN